jgi:2-dehydro-3-deoxy-L-rhamnonate dehydrogenase (NAD+)
MMTTRYDFTGRCAVVTGGAQGIGRAVVEVLLAGGASVAIWDRDKALADATAAELASSGTIAAVAVDVADAASVAEAHGETMSRFGKIDILVNNAGVAGLNAKVADYPIEEWDRVMTINLKSQFLCCRQTIPGMIERNYGRICNVASIAGKEGNPNMTGYSATKAGVIGFTKSLAKEVATQGICVNAVAPAVVRTRILDQLTPAQIEYMTERIPMKRTGQPEEIAAVVHFLSSPDCSFVTGQCYDASGGRATY